MEINQKSFRGGMNLLVDDTRPTADVEGDTSQSRYEININQYRIGFNARCRYDVLDPVLSSLEDTSLPEGIKQGILTFGDYVICFVGGYAFFRPITSTGWTQIVGFAMDLNVPRYWFIPIPVAETNYGRLGVAATEVGSTTVTGVSNSRAGINAVNVSSAFQGNLPGLLVQDGINQPQFIFLDSNNNNFPSCRVTQMFSEWTLTIDPITLIVSVDNREYVPIGTQMDIYNGILFILAPDGTNIYRSVSGRPLDFVVNVKPDGTAGGDATTTSYSIGTGNISCLKTLSSGLFVSAGNACFSVTLNTNPTAPTLFGEYTFIRTFLFTAACLSDRAIIDINGDTAFVDVNGLRSFNSILQTQNEGRNSVFSKTVASLFVNVGSNGNNINVVQNPLNIAAVTFDNYALFAVNTSYGQIIVVYDTISEVYVSLDRSQFPTNTGIKQFALVATEVTALFAITFDDRLIQLYCGGLSGTLTDTAIVRFMSVCSQNPKAQIKQKDFRCVLSQFNKDSTATLSTFVDNRLVATDNPQSKSIKYVTPSPVYNQQPYFQDANSQVQNLYFSTPNCGEGWKVWNVLTWTGGGHITNILTTTVDITPTNPLSSQANVT